jgi:hypothetical protein
MIIHEFGHVWDKRMGHREATWFGGGPGDMLSDFVGGKSTATLRWLPGQYCDRFQYKDGFGYGNTSAADYFAHCFTSVVAAQENPNVVQRVTMWVGISID